MEREKMSRVVAEDDEMKGLGEELFEEGREEEEGEGEDVQGTASKKTWKTFTPRQKAVKLILRRAGKDKFPELKQILAGKWGTEVRVKDIGIFIGDVGGDEVMAELAKECPVRNRVNLSAEVQKRRVLDIGSQVVEAGKMYQPISVARIKDDGRLECTSGRHRLAFIALAYGSEVRIPVYVEEMTLNEARDAVVVSNQARPTKALERAEHTVLQAVRGDANAAQDDLYYRAVTAKSRAKRYCVFSVVNRGWPARLSFKASNESSRKDGGMTTLANVENFWGSALEWKDGMARKAFDASLKESVRFMNAVVAAMQAVKGFLPRQHLAAMTMTAIGKYYRTYEEATGASATALADKVARSLVGMGDIGRQKSEKTYAALVKLVPLRK